MSHFHLVSKLFNEVHDSLFSPASLDIKYFFKLLTLIYANSKWEDLFGQPWYLPIGVELIATASFLTCNRNVFL